MATNYITLDNPIQSAPIANKNITFGVSRDSFIDYFPHETITKVEVTMSNQIGHKNSPNWLDTPYSLHEVRIEACGNNLTTSRLGKVKVTTFISSDPNKTTRVHIYNITQIGGTDIVPPFPRVEFSLSKPYGDPGSTLKGEITTNLPYYKKNSLEVNRNTYIIGKISALAESDSISISVDPNKADYYNDTWHIPITITLGGTKPTLNERGLKVYSLNSKELAITVSVDNTTNVAHKVRSTRKGWVTVMGKNRMNGNHNIGTILTHYENLGSEWIEVKNDEYGHYKPSQGEEIPNTPSDEPNTPTEILLNSITLTGSNEVEVGKTISLTAATIPSDATNKTLVWTSSNSAIATVNNGIVKGISAGTATIVATALDGSGVTGSILINVKTPLTNPTEYSYVGMVDINQSDTHLMLLKSDTYKVENFHITWNKQNLKWMDTTSAYFCILTKESMPTIKLNGALAQLLSIEGIEGIPSGYLLYCITSPVDQSSFNSEFVVE